MFKKVLAIMLAVFMLAGVLSITVFAEEGEEPETPPTEIYTIEDLYMINYNLDGNFILMNDIDMTEATAEGGDWDYMGNGWEPIGSNGIYSGSTPFTGTFDGNGHEIISMRIDVTTLPTGTGDVYAGLFAYNKGTIKNLTVSGNVNASISANYLCDLGSVSGYNRGTIECCGNNADVTVNCVYSGYAGGIAACNNDNGIISKCYNTGNISASYTGTGSYSNIAYYSSGISNSSGSISDCYNTGSIIATNTYNSSYAYSGGISAYSSGTTKNCYNIGSAKYAVSRGTSTNCYFLNGIGADNVGAKAHTDTQMKLLDTFIGFDSENTWFVDETAEYQYPQLKNNMQIKDSVISEAYQPVINDGVVEIRTIRDLYYVNRDLSGSYKLMNDIDMTEATSEGGDWDYAGYGWEPIGSKGIYSSTTPFTGTFDGNGYEIKGMRIDVKSLPSGTGNVYAGLFAYNKGLIQNLGISGSIAIDITAYNTYSYAGGVAGWSNNSIINCYNKVDVSTKNDNYYCYSSGIACCGSNGMISDCYNTGTITATSSSYSTYSAGISASTYGTISNCYNIGTAKKAISYVTVTNCYFLNGSGTDTTGAKSLTDGQMKLKGVYGGFDFDNVWYINNKAEYPYPQHRISIHESEEPTEAPTEAPTDAPTDAPTEAPTEAPTVIKVVYVLGDVDGDLDASVIDATYIQRYNAGFNTPFAIGEPIEIG